MNLITLKNINKRYGTNHVIKSLDCTISKNKIFGLLGPNGAGKTTLMRLMTRITLPDSGNLFYAGKKFTQKDVRKIGYMPEERGLYINMKVTEHLMYIAKLYDIDRNIAKKRIDEWLSKLGMASVAHKLIGALSKGMSQKIQFIATVLHQPELLVLDEPFSGLDPVSAQALETELISLSNTGTTVILSTHRMDQVENFCDHVLLINHGTRVIEGTVKELKNKFRDNILKIETNATIPQEILDQYHVVSKAENTYHLKLETIEDKRRIFSDLFQNRIDIISLYEILPSMHDIFIRLITQRAKTEPINNPGLKYTPYPELAKRKETEKIHF